MHGSISQMAVFSVLLLFLVTSVPALNEARTRFRLIGASRALSLLLEECQAAALSFRTPVTLSIENSRIILKLPLKEKSISLDSGVKYELKAGIYEEIHCSPEGIFNPASFTLGLDDTECVIRTALRGRVRENCHER